MRCKIPEISWHNRDPVLSVDIQPKSLNSKNFTVDKNNEGAENCELAYRLASGGSDSHVVIWHLKLMADKSDVTLEPVADLTRHQHAVNVVKWSPNGEFLASGDDESVIFIWKQKTETDPPNIFESNNEQDKEVWLTMKVLRGHTEDVYDLSWAPNSQFLVSGSVDNTAIIWDVQRGKSMHHLRDHKSFVQGVAWDPCNQYVATLSTDRYLRIFDIQTKRTVQRVNKGIFNVPEGHEYHGKRLRYFHDDTLQSYFRRLSFTPDGKLLLTPAGVADYEGCTRVLYTSYGFSRYSFKQPALVLPCPDQYTVAITCCPLLFKLREHDAEKNPPVVPLPYRMIFAVATRSSVYFYDTQQHQPFAMISNIHYTHLTDISWSMDGHVVVVSSTDGFCSVIIFKEGELGEKYDKMEEVLSTLAPSDFPLQKKSKKHKENETTAVRNPSADDNGIGNKTKSTTSRPLTENVNSKPKTSESAYNKKDVATAEENNKIDIKDTKDAGSTSTSLDGEKRIQSNDSTIIESSSLKKFDSTVKDPIISDSIASGSKSLAADLIIIDKEILSSDERFESPEKKSRPATPITIRRHPRTPSSGHTPLTTPTSSVKPSLVVQSNNSNVKSTASPSGIVPNVRSPHPSKKTATPIAVRRTPRSLITNKRTEPPETPGLVEEAMDAWPSKIPDSPPKQSAMDVDMPETSTTTTKAADKSTTIDQPSMELTVERTEDIRLVYEDTTPTQESIINKSMEKSLEDKSTIATGLVSGAPARNKEEEELLTSTCNPNTPKQPLKPLTPNNKTPRRVEFKTISTPKSKKKLL